MAEHSTIESANCHEPKYMTISTASDAGKVLTPVSVGGSCELRFLQESEIANKQHFFTFKVADLIPAASGVVDTDYGIIAPFTGTLTYIGVSLQGTALPALPSNVLYILAANSGVLRAALNTTMSVGNLTLTGATAACTTLDTVVSASNSITAGQQLIPWVDVLTAGAVPATITIGLTRP